MLVRRVVSCLASGAVLALLLTGCAKTNRDMAAAMPSPADQQTQSQDTSTHKSHTDDSPLPDDPVSKLPPMPVALLEKIKQLSQPDHGGAVAFLAPIATNVSFTASTTTLGPAPDAEQPYLLDSGDRVRVFVYGQPNLSRSYPVDGAGFIAVPLIGNVKARGLTTYHLAREIAAQLGVRYVRDPEVTAEIVAYRPFFILGEVRAAGQYPFVSGLTVEAAVAIAGGYSPRASEREVRITRHIDGEVAEVHVPPSERVLPGDTIYVDERWF